MLIQQAADTAVKAQETTAWYTDPLLIVLGLAAAIVVVTLIAAAARGPVMPFDEE
jgi:hypothetical protein